MRRLLFCVLAAVALACSDQVTEVNRQLYLTAIADSTFRASAAIPPGLIKPEPQYLPSVACYFTHDPTNNQWEVAADGWNFFASPVCVVSLFRGQWFVHMVQIPPGWTAAWVVTY